jgi:hypothetical protein
MSPLCRRLLILLASGLLFVCAFPLSFRHLEHFMYWTSLMSWPGYEPLLYWEPMFFDSHWELWKITLLVAVLILAGLTALMRRSSVRQIALAVACPIFLALTVQYAAITRLDDHVFWFLTKGIVRGLLWQFDLSALLTCITISIIYSAIATVPFLVARFIDRRLPKSPNQAMQPTAGRSDA